MSDATPVLPESAAVSDGASARRSKRRALVAFALLAMGLAGWWFGVELPERRAAVELKRQQAEKSFRIADLNLDMVWIPPGTFRMGEPEQNFLARWFYYVREKFTHQPNPGNGSIYDDEWPVT